LVEVEKLETPLPKLNQATEKIKSNEKAKATTLKVKMEQQRQQKQRLV
jgi:hypothetical protein